MREWKDKHWDAKYEQFRLEKQRRREDAGIKPAVEKTKPVIDLNRAGYNSYRNKIKPVKEERIFLNKGPSRFLKTHSSNVEVDNYAKSQVSAASTPSISNYTPANDLIIEEEKPALHHNKFNVIDYLPYAIIILALIAVYFVFFR